jgi:hypothetical protein
MILAESVAAALDSENVKPVSWSTTVTARACSCKDSGDGLPVAARLVSAYMPSSKRSRLTEADKRNESVGCTHCYR